MYVKDVAVEINYA